MKEAFTEFQIPLLKDIPAVQRLDTNIAARWADYSGSGSRVGVEGRPVVGDQRPGPHSRHPFARRARGQPARSLRPDSRRFHGATDRAKTPPTTVSGTELLGWQIRTVKPEKADTTTAGIVFQPSFLEGFQASVDW